MLKVSFDLETNHILHIYICKAIQLYLLWFQFHEVNRKKRRAKTKTHSFCCCRLFVHLTNFITSKGIFERNMLKDCDKKTKCLVFKFTEMSTFLAFVSIYSQENKMLSNEIARVVISKDLHIYEHFFSPMHPTTVR